MTPYPAPATPGVLHEATALDREPYLSLIRAVLAWTGPKETLQPRDYEQIALQLTGQARAVAADVQRRACALPWGSGRRALTDIVLRETQRRLAVPLVGTVRCVQSRARLVRALYARLDRLTESPAAASQEH
ncbi:restriction endonuclease [Streptomyces sp. Ac-502]|uniref:restriction endonuclease n=1 Tax=Streptomyces sp. Ac-502 TaxID=3342801 RepID=UPI003862450C